MPSDRSEERRWRTGGLALAGVLLALHLLGALNAAGNADQSMTCAPQSGRLPLASVKPYTRASSHELHN